MAFMPPTRIASFLASPTEILYGLGLGERVVAVSHECDFPDEVRLKPRITRTNVNAEASSRDIDQQVKAACAAGEPLYQIDIPMLVELRPDLIVTQAQCDVCAVRYADVIAAVREHTALAETQVVSLNPKTLDCIFDDIRRVGEAARVADRAEAYVQSLRSRVEAVRSRTKVIPANRRQRVACIEWIDPPMLAGNWMPELIEIAGGRCDLTQPGRHSTFADWSDIVAFDPEVIVIMSCGFDLQRTLAEAPTLRTFPNWNEISAVRDGRVFAADGNAYFNRSGPRLVDSLEILDGLLQADFYEKMCMNQPKPVVRL